MSNKTASAAARKLGKRCLKTMTKEQRQERGRKAAKARWGEPCGICGGKGFINQDGSINNACEGSDSGPLIPCPAACQPRVKPKPPASAR